MNILIADDDPLTLEALSACMTAEGFETINASNGQEALDLWESAQPDLLCLDIMMPEMDGYELCRNIRKRDQQVPILFLSAKNQDIDIAAGLDLGADDFIRKPFTRTEVMARIRAALRRIPPKEEHQRFLISDLEVDPTRLQVVRNGQAIDLTPREVSILWVLYENRGKPVSRDTLLDRCWGIDYFPDSRTLDQHIYTLRKKLQSNPNAPPVILSVRGIGYRVPN